MSNSQTDAGKPRLAALLAGAGVIVVTVVLVLAFGVSRPPELAPVDASNPPSAALAWTQWSDANVCVHIVEPDGTLREPWCERDWIDLVAWTDEGLIVHRWANTTIELVIDPASGAVIERRQADEDERRYPGDALYSLHVDGQLTVEDVETGEQLWKVDVSSVYNVWAGSLSPDGRWIAAGDNADRLLLFDREGGEPRVWATGVEAGGALLWQGEDLRVEAAAASDDDTRR